MKPGVGKTIKKKGKKVKVKKQRKTVAKKKSSTLNEATDLLGKLMKVMERHREVNWCFWQRVSL